MKRNLLRSIFFEDVPMNDKKLKAIEEQLDLVEKNIPDLKSKVNDYSARKVAETKCMDKIVKLLIHYAHSATGNTTLKFSIQEFAKILNQLNQHLRVFSSDLDKNVVQDLGEFKMSSKHLRNDLKKASTAAEQEKCRRRQLQRLEHLRDQEHDRISAAEAELLKAKAENARTTKALEEHAEIFEQKKLSGLRATLLAWTTLELRYHARALELFTDAYRAAATINVESDLRVCTITVVNSAQEFCNKVQAEVPVRLVTVQHSLQHYTDYTVEASQRPSSRQSVISSSGFMDRSH